MTAPTLDPLSTELYKQYCEDLRFYGNMRFKQLTLWSVGMGFLLHVLYGGPPTEGGSYQMGNWYFAALCWTAVIWVMEVRSSVHGVRRMRLKGQFEPPGSSELNPKWTLVNATNAVALLYAAASLAWLVQLTTLWGLKVATPWIGAAILVFLVAFTAREYHPMWAHALTKWGGKDL